MKILNFIEKDVTSFVTYYVKTYSMTGFVAACALSPAPSTKSMGRVRTGTQYFTLEFIGPGGEPLSISTVLAFNGYMRIHFSARCNNKTQTKERPNGSVLALKISNQPRIIRCQRRSPLHRSFVATWGPKLSITLVVKESEGFSCCLCHFSRWALRFYICLLPDGVQ